MRKSPAVTVARMSLFQIGAGFVSILVVGVLNRVMFTEIGLAPALVGFLLAIPPLTSLIRPWVGYVSDSRPIFGRRRFPYIVAGMMLAVLGVLGGTVSTLSIPTVAVWGVFAAVGAFVVYGVGKSAMHTVSQALIPDVFDDKWRPIAATVLRAMFIAGLIGGGHLLEKLVDPYSPSRLLLVVAGTGVAAIILTVLGNVGIEPTGEDVDAMCSRAREASFWTTMKPIAQNPQVRIFFSYVALILLSTLSQDLFLEPYGAEVFGMSVGETAGLNKFWGAGTLTAMLVGGVVLGLLKGRGRKLVSAIGLVIVALVFVGLIVVGSRGHADEFRLLVLFLGVGSGIVAAAALALMIDFTSPEYAGLLMGAWTMAHQAAEFVGNLGGGIVIGVAYAMSGSYIAAFGALFGLEVVFALIGLVLLARINVEAFQESSLRPQHAATATSAMEAVE